jgi:hypothetical protein
VGLRVNGAVWERRGKRKGGRKRMWRVVVVEDEVSWIKDDRPASVNAGKAILRGSYADSVEASLDERINIRALNPI